MQDLWMGFKDNSDYFTNFNTKFEIITKKMFCLKLSFFLQPFLIFLKC